MGNRGPSLCILQGTCARGSNEFCLVTACEVDFFRFPISSLPILTFERTLQGSWPTLLDYYPWLERHPGLVPGFEPETMKSTRDNDNELTKKIANYVAESRD